MTTRVADDNDAVVWKPQQKIEETIKTFVSLQSGKQRDLDAERAIAKEVNEYVHRADNPDFPICVAVQTRFTFWGRYYPIAWINARDDLQKWAKRICGSLEAAERLEQRTADQVSTIFSGFYLGTDLGYPEVLGEDWYLVFCDDSGSTYVPIDAVETVIETKF